MSARIRKVKKSKKKMALLTEPPPSCGGYPAPERMFAMSRKTTSMILAMTLRLYERRNIFCDFDCLGRIDTYPVVGQGGVEKG